jgi:hypothetical protein
MSFAILIAAVFVWVMICDFYNHMEKMEKKDN